MRCQQREQRIPAHFDALLAQALFQQVVKLTATHTAVLLAQLRDLIQDILLALLAAPLPRLVLVIGLPAKPKYAADPPQAKVRTAYS